MTSKYNNFFNKGSFMILLILLSSLLFTYCSSDIDEDTSSVEFNTTTYGKSLYFYGSDAEFEKLKGVEMTHISTKQELNNINQNSGNSIALFVGKDIDVRSGIINDFRNSGILVTQLEKEIATPKKLPAQSRLLIEEKSNSKATSMDNTTNDEQLHFVTYLSVNGAHKILGSVFDNMEQAVPRIIEWEEKKRTETPNLNFDKSGNKTCVLALDWDFIWNQVGDFGLDTEVFKADTPGYMLNNGSGTQEYADTFIYEHKIVATPTNPNQTWSVGNIQVIQEPEYNDFTGIPLDFSLREYSPLNSDNGVLDGRTGSDSFGYGLDFGIEATGGSIGSSFDWSHTTDWSIPACQVKTFHNAVSELFKVMYDVDSNGAWSGSSVTAENYTYYATNADAVGYWENYHHAPTVYFVHMAPNNHVDKDLYIYADANGVLKVWQYHSGYFDNPNDNTYYSQYSW
jgi:hypothetical protein